MSTLNKHLLLKTFFLMLGVYFIVIYIAYALFKSYAVEENEAKLQDLLMHNKALHTYVEEQLKPVIYNLAKEGKIEKDFFDPKILSFTYMSRNIMNEYNKQRVKNNIEEIQYKFASDNPRNPLNKADANESEILKSFNAKKIDKYHKHLKIQNKEYIFYAMPVTTNAESCMRCHGNPQSAPKSLLQLYGDKAGFYENIGDIRAFISVVMPLEVELGKMLKIYRLFALILFLLLAVVFVIIFYFIKKIDIKDAALLEQASKDALTKIYNRRVFNQDIERISNQRKGHIQYLMIIDIDHFKTVNDTFGHSSGDKVLIELCNIIAKNTRDSDKFYRIGGEEFAILSFANSIEDEVEFAQRLRKEVKSTRFDKIDSLTISIGISQQMPEDSGHALFNRADKALYDAKENGRDQVRVFTNAL